VEPEPSSQVPEDRPLSELSPVPVCELAESRTSPQPHPTLPGERVVDEVDDYKRPPVFPKYPVGVWRRITLSPDIARVLAV
jgi:hypothetical protein